MEISEWNWKSFDDLDMYARAWTPDGKPTAVLLLVIGLGEHVSRYDHVGAALANKGYALLGFDTRGHGKSGGRRGCSPSTEAFMLDIDSMLSQAATRYPGTRQFIYGHSLGGILVLNYLLCRQPALAGAVVTSPGLRTALETQKVKVMLAKVLGTLMPSVTMPSGLDAKMISRLPEVVDRYKQDPLVHDRLSFGMGKDMLVTISWIYEHASELQIPLLLMHGTDDKLAFVRGSREFAQKAGRNVTLKEWDGLWHELHNEPEQAQVFAFVIDWLDKHLPN